MVDGVVDPNHSPAMMKDIMFAIVVREFASF